MLYQLELQALARTRPAMTVLVSARPYMPCVMAHRVWALISSVHVCVHRTSVRYSYGQNTKIGKTITKRSATMNQMQSTLKKMRSRLFTRLFYGACASGRIRTYDGASASD